MNKSEAISDPCSGKRVLVVDDSKLILQVVDRALCQYGFVVVAMSSALEAIKWCDRCGAPDLLLTDVFMPDIDGPTLYQLLNKKFPEMPVLFMSGGQSAWQNENFLPTMRKPFALSSLDAMIRAAISPQQLQYTGRSH